jgi:BirA family transcriptional regulator, biotin operon repressor / biotin---[acetyl-CoA-carboxylase] ligase
MNINVLTFDTLDSTNTEALKQARLGGDEGLCIVARQQTAGRGRHGRKWVSDEGAGLYFSIVLRPIIETRFLPLITLMTGVAVHDSLQEYGLKPDIKWVNDILVNEKKISGILAETTETSTGLAVIVGIGINIRSTNYPDEIADIATSIEAESPQPEAAATGNLTETLTKYVSYFYEILQSEGGSAHIIQEWRRRSSYFSAKNVRVVMENETITGTTDGLEENGALRVRAEDGAIRIIQAGDVEQLRPTEIPTTNE